VKKLTFNLGVDFGVRVWYPNIEREVARMKHKKLEARIFFYDKGMDEHSAVTIIRDSREEIDKFINEMPSVFEFIEIKIKEWG